ncbi:MAG TPA: DNA internalization-related competence protein ComEC/Rec2 [Gammaproteobacteria bacterium]|nr:DNA internalization-related competence protein ComEC/Rec2 [Gammaproteobacteria bacterium]
MAIILLWMPQRMPGKWLSVIWLLPLIMVRPSPPEKGTFSATFLDVGQGLSVVVQTTSHALLFDTGARFSDRFNAVDSVVLPFLRAQGITRIDTLVLSHADNDHAGGANRLYRKFPIGQTLASFQPNDLHLPWYECEAGQTWVWDDVVFKILHPSPDWQGAENERSCVLAVGDKTNRLLLTGDIGRKAEQWLLALNPPELAAKILQVPHHGSRTSSTAGFIDAVQPDYAVFTVGYRNRFGFPKPDIVMRYHHRGITTLRTDRTGAIRYRPDHKPGATPLSLYRELHRHIWQSVE